MVQVLMNAVAEGVGGHIGRGIKNICRHKQKRAQIWPTIYLTAAEAIECRVASEY